MADRRFVGRSSCTTASIKTVARFGERRTSRSYGRQGLTVPTVTDDYLAGVQVASRWWPHKRATREPCWLWSRL